MSEGSKEDVIEQIRKVLRLAERAATDGEKFAADAAAKRLAAKHGINLEDIEVTNAAIKTECILEGEVHSYPKTELGYITSVLRQHFGIILIQHSTGRDRKVRLEWVGTKLNIAIAKHITILLLRACQKDWTEARLTRKYAKTLKDAPGYHDPQKQRALVALANLNKRAFLDGWFWTIHQKLNEHPLRNDREQLEAEKKAAEEMLEKMKQEQDIKEKKKESSMNPVDRKSVIIGYQAAQKINLSRPCEAGSYRGSPLALQG